MFWYPGFIFFAAWVVMKFLLHKSGFVHMFLLAAIGCCVVQLIQDRRTKAYYEEVGGRPQ
ncbi:MAG TPA: hypothetical protein VIU65_02865 [Pyrinomonadaceae bacterium]